MGIERQKSETGPDAFHGNDNYIFNVYNKLLRQVLSRISMERAALLLKRKDDLTLEAEVYKKSTDRIVTISVYQLNSISNPESYLPLSYINKICGSKGDFSVIFPKSESDYYGDPYLKQKKPGCVICATINAETETPGILYLESENPLDLNSRENKNLLDLCLDQASLSLENTRCYAQLQSQLADRLQELNAIKKTKSNENQARIRFLQGMNQELQAPLNSIIGFSQLLMKKGKQLHLPSEIKNYIKKIEMSGVELNELLSNILVHSLGDPETHDPIFSRFDIKPLLKSLVHGQYNSISETERDVRIEIRGVFPDSIYSDRSLVTRALMFLAGNAIRRSTAGQTIIIRGIKETENLVLRFEDEGPPLSDRIRQPLFCDLSTADENNLSPLDFLNLEMSSAEETAVRLGGKLEYRIMENQRSAFTLHIPVKEPESITRNDINPSAHTAKSRSADEDPSRNINSATLMNAEDLVPDETPEQILTELKSLASIPIYKGRTLISRIRQLKQICENSNLSFLSALEDLEKSVFDGNINRFNSIINCILDQTAS